MDWRIPNQRLHSTAGVGPCFFFFFFFGPSCVLIRLLARNCIEQHLLSILTPRCYWMVKKGRSGCVCDLWPVAEPSQKKQEEKSEKPDQQVGQQYNGEVNKSMDIKANRSWNRCVRSLFIWRVKSSLCINAHQPTQPKKRPSHNQYSNPADLLPLPVILASAAACILPGGPRLSSHLITMDIEKKKIWSLYQ